MKTLILPTATLIFLLATVGVLSVQYDCWQDGVSSGQPVDDCCEGDALSSCCVEVRYVVPDALCIRPSRSSSTLIPHPEVIQTISHDSVTVEAVFSILPYSSPPRRNLPLLI